MNACYAFDINKIGSMEFAIYRCICVPKIINFGQSISQTVPASLILAHLVYAEMTTISCPESSHHHYSLLNALQMDVYAMPVNC